MATIRNMVCEECGFEYKNVDIDELMDNLCPNCGQFMKTFE